MLQKYNLPFLTFPHVPSLLRLQLAKKFHPDSNKDKGAKEKFVEIQEAYDVRPVALQLLLPVTHTVSLSDALGRQEARRL